MDERIVCRILTGPTASGKSDWGLRMAEEQGWVIVCMDSMQIYRGMDIGTAKPTPEERRRVRHELLDICEPTDAFSVAAYRDRAEALIRELWEKEGKEALFVGGTGLYMQALIHPMDMGGTEADPALRAELRTMAETAEGRRALHAQLAGMDPETAERLPVNDVRRIIRAIEVTKATGIPFSRQPLRTETSPFAWKIAAVRMPREQLYDRINRRVTKMIDSGLAEEVRGLLAAGVPEDAQSMSGIGYKEMIPCIRGEYSLEEAADRIRLNTRHYAKRQMTFLRREPEVKYIDADKAGAYEALTQTLA